MRKMLLLVTVVVLASFASAQSSNAMGRNTVTKDFPNSGVHTLKNTTINANALNVSEAAGFHAIDAATTVLCPGTSGTCIIQADQWIQLVNGVTGNKVAICFYVDGTAVDGCYYTGETNSDGTYSQQSTSHASNAVPFGKHTVQTVLYTLDGATVSFYNFNYRVYKP
jgi:hypothetical protein